MRRSRLIIPSFVALSLMAGAATAQQNSASMAPSPPPMTSTPPPPPDHDMGGPNDLNLSPQQKEQVRQIMEEEHQQTHDRLSKVLTPEQMAKWDARMRRGPGGPHSHPMMPMMPAKPGQMPPPTPSTP